MTQALPNGTYVPLVTPFTAEGEIDYESWIRLVDKMLDANVEALIVLGTTGESPTINSKEAAKLISHTVNRAKGSTKVLAGIGSNDTRATLLQANSTMDLGVDGLLVVCPYYSRPTQQGLFDHFRVIAENVHLPQIVYNIENRTGVNVHTNTLLELSKLPNIVGVKESSNNIEQANEVVQMLSDDFLVLCGCDHLNLLMLCLGGHGVISTVANIVPGKVKSMVDAALDDDIRTARELHFELMPLVAGCSACSNPIPVKTALALTGEMQEKFRLPLCPMTAQDRDHWSTVLERYGLKKRSSRKQTVLQPDVSA